MRTSAGPEAKRIKNLFSEVASSYDRANDFMTFKLAHGWRQKLVKLAETSPKGRVLDCATGTGDLALEFKEHLGENAEVIGIDFCKEMLDFAPGKALDRNLEVDFQLGDVLDLKFESSSFNTVSIAYGIRNVEDPKKGLEEMWRVLKPGGKLLVLETGEGKSLAQLPARLYTKYGIPLIGGLIGNNKGAYKYLSESSQNFPAGKDFIELGRGLNDLKKSHFKSLFLGASYIYIFEKN